MVLVVDCHLGQTALSTHRFLKMFEQITILGAGLLGASIGMAARKRAICKRVHVWSRRAETRGEAAKEDWVDAVFDHSGEACRASQLIVLCTPVDSIVPLLGQVAESLDNTALVTDVGSTKGNICRDAAALGTLRAQFIGSHPMAGSEQTGMTHAEAELFEGAACIVTPLEATPEAPTSQLKDFWTALGMRVACMSPERHDEAVAHISHLPHLLTAALCSFLAERDPSWKALAGGGLRDTTRIAAGDPNLWRGILEGNREEVARAVTGLEGELQQIKAALINKDTTALDQYLESGKRYRDQL